jgi:alpha-aminoadipic semialdehyde synthase
MSKIGIRHEDKYLLEKRVAITPLHVERLIKEFGLEVYVQSSAKRIFTDDEYKKAGAVIVEEFPDDVKTIFGVKEMPIDFFREGDTVIFFSHTIKGQAYNMPMLRRMKDKKVNLIEYERIVDKNGKRIIFFGRFAGLAGAINSLWSLGQRFDRKGIENPFSVIKQAHKYSSLDEAKEVIKKVGEEIKTKGLNKKIAPLVIGITGYGNVSRGAQEILDLLPFKEISADELVNLKLNENDNRFVYKTVFKEQDLSEPVEEGYEFELQDYYDNPEKYKNKFERYVPKLTLLMNCMYWTPKYPRIITKDYLAEHFASGEARLEVIGDVTCDPDGSIECTHMGTLIQDPVFVYNPFTRQPAMGFDGDGVLVMAVDILPSELPKDSSIAFGNALYPFIAPIANADFSKPFDKLELPPEIKGALILHQGRLTPDYQYINKYLKSRTH